MATTVATKIWLGVLGASFSLLLAVSDSMQSPNVVSQQPDASKNLSFITVHGSVFVEKETCKQFVFSGAHVFQLLDISAGVAGPPSDIDKLFDSAKRQGLGVIRCFAFGDGGNLKLQTAPGVYNYETFRALDYVLARAAAYGIRLILVPVDNWKYSEGKMQYVNWGGGSDPMDFFNLQSVRQIYMNHVKALTNRVNSYTGKAYRDDSVIFAWDLMNEPTSTCDITNTKPSSCSASATINIQKWIDDMAAYWKQQDSNHLLTVGEEGFFGPGSIHASEYNPNHDGSHWALSSGQNFTANHASQNIDYASFHLWPDNWKTNTSYCNTTRIPGMNPSCGAQFVNNWITSHMKAANGKPVVLEEFGKQLDLKAGQTDSADRSLYFHQIYQLYLDSILHGGSFRGILSFGYSINKERPIDLNFYPGTTTWDQEVQPVLNATRDFLAAQQPLSDCNSLGGNLKSSTPGNPAVTQPAVSGKPEQSSVSGMSSGQSRPESSANSPGLTGLVDSLLQQAGLLSGGRL